MTKITSIGLLVFLVVAGLYACQREAPTEKSHLSQPNSSVDQAAQRAVDSIKTPLDKARGVESTLEKAAEQTADRVKEAAR